MKPSSAKFNSLAKNNRRLYPTSQKEPGRICVEGRWYWHFASNDYLGLSDSAQLKQAACEATQRWGTGSMGSRLLGGDFTLFHDLEQAIARYKHKPAALLFNSGYQLNVGLIRCLVGPGDVVFADKFSHASLLDGVLLSGATLYRFAHNDMAHLTRLLDKHRSTHGQALILTESVFSMDGDTAPIAELISLKQAYKTLLLIDEAHAIGTIGEHGEGLIDSIEKVQYVDYIVGTFGKAFGSAGAFVACSEEARQQLINICRSFIFSTALPPSVVATSLAALQVIQKQSFHLDLQRKVGLFREALAPLNPLGSTHIVPIVCGDAQKTNHMAGSLREKGYFVLPIHPPTVPEGKSRLRLSVTLAHSDEVLKDLAAAILQSVTGTDAL